MAAEGLLLAAVGPAAGGGVLVPGADAATVEAVCAGAFLARPSDPVRDLPLLQQLAWRYVRAVLAEVDAARAARLAAEADRIHRLGHALLADERDLLPRSGRVRRLPEPLFPGALFFGEGPGALAPQRGPLVHPGTRVPRRGLAARDLNDVGSGAPRGNVVIDFRLTEALFADARAWAPRRGPFANDRLRSAPLGLTDHGALVLDLAILAAPGWPRGQHDASASLAAGRGLLATPGSAATDALGLGGAPLAARSGAGASAIHLAGADALVSRRGLVHGNPLPESFLLDTNTRAGARRVGRVRFLEALFFDANNRHHAAQGCAAFVLLPLAAPRSAAVVFLVGEAEVLGGGLLAAPHGAAALRLAGTRKWLGAHRVIARIKPPRRSSPLSPTSSPLEASLQEVAAGDLPLEFEVGSLGGGVIAAGLGLVSASQASLPAAPSNSSPTNMSRGSQTSSQPAPAAPPSPSSSSSSQTAPAAPPSPSSSSSRSSSARGTGRLRKNRFFIGRRKAMKPRTQGTGIKKLGQLKSVLGDIVWFAIPNVLLFYPRKVEGNQAGDAKLQGQKSPRLTLLGITSNAEDPGSEKNIVMAIFGIFVTIWVAAYLLANFGRGNNCRSVVGVLTYFTVLSVLAFIDYMLSKSMPPDNFYTTLFSIHFGVTACVITYIWAKYVEEPNWKLPNFQVMIQRLRIWCQGPHQEDHRANNPLLDHLLVEEMARDDIV